MPKCVNVRLKLRKRRHSERILQSCLNRSAVVRSGGSLLPHYRVDVPGRETGSKHHARQQKRLPDQDGTLFTERRQKPLSLGSLVDEPLSVTEGNPAQQRDRDSNKDLRTDQSSVPFCQNERVLCDVPGRTNGPRCREDGFDQTSASCSCRIGKSSCRLRKPKAAASKESLVANGMRTEQHACRPQPVLPFSGLERASTQISSSSGSS